jgi:hypothetical protein
MSSLLLHEECKRWMPTSRGHVRVQARPALKVIAVLHPAVSGTTRDVMALQNRNLCVAKWTANRSAKCGTSLISTTCLMSHLDCNISNHGCASVQRGLRAIP